VLVIVQVLGKDVEVLFLFWFFFMIEASKFLPEFHFRTCYKKSLIKLKNLNLVSSF